MCGVFLLGAVGAIGLAPLRNASRVIVLEDRPKLAMPIGGKQSDSRGFAESPPGADHISDLFPPSPSDSLGSGIWGRGSFASTNARTHAEARSAARARNVASQQTTHSCTTLPSHQAIKQSIITHSYIIY